MDHHRRMRLQGLAATPALGLPGCTAEDDPRDSRIDTTRYLPYRLHATPAQFARAYPEAQAFAALKRQVDPRGRFTNRLWQANLPR